MTKVIEKPHDMHQLCMTLRAVIAEARRVALYSEVSTRPGEEVVLISDSSLYISPEFLEAMFESLGISQAQLFVEDRVIKMRLKAHHLVELVLAWEVTTIERVHDELMDIAASIGAQAFIVMLGSIMQIVRRGDRAKAEEAATELEGHANRLGPALTLYIDGLRSKLKSPGS